MAVTRLLANLALASIVVAFVASLAAIAIKPGLDPTTTGISLYALGPLGFVQNGAILLVGFGSIALAVGMRRDLAGAPRSGLGSALVAAWGGCVVVAAVLPVDVYPARSLTGFVHDVAGNLANLFLIAGIVSLLDAFVVRLAWRTFRVQSIALAATALGVVVVANLGRPTIPWGASQRIYILLLLLWLALAALRLRRSGQSA